MNMELEPAPGEVLCVLERLWLDLGPSVPASARDSQIEEPRDAFTDLAVLEGRKRWNGYRGVRGL